jgi:glycine hydroxymethyltransferase
MADISHIAGLIVGGVHPSPVPYAHIITTTTHKTLRGPRGALIMVTDKGLKKNPDLPKKIESAIIPGLQGGPHDNQTAAIAVALHEASTASFKRYAKQIVKNAEILAAELIKYDFQIVSGGTENHLLLVDLRNKGVNGAVAAFALEQAGIILNKNGVPNDTMPPFFPSGIRLGTPALTTRGMKALEMKQIAKWMNEVIEEVHNLELPADKDARREMWKQHKKQIAGNKKLAKIAHQVKNLCINFPI